MRTPRRGTILVRSPQQSQILRRKPPGLLDTHPFASSAAATACRKMGKTPPYTVSSTGISKFLARGPVKLSAFSTTPEPFARSFAARARRARRELSHAFTPLDPSMRPRHRHGLGFVSQNPPRAAAGLCFCIRRNFCFHLRLRARPRVRRSCSRGFVSHRRLALGCRLDSLRRARRSRQRRLGSTARAVAPNHLRWVELRARFPVCRAGRRGFVSHRRLGLGCRLDGRRAGRSRQRRLDRTAGAVAPDQVRPV